MTACNNINIYIVFRDRGFRVYLVPEASTIIQGGGASVTYVDKDDVVVVSKYYVEN